MNKIFDIEDQMHVDYLRRVARMHYKAGACDTALEFYAQAALFISLYGVSCNTATKLADTAPENSFVG